MAAFASSGINEYNSKLSKLIKVSQVRACTPLRVRYCDRRWSLESGKNIKIGAVIAAGFRFLPRFIYM